MTESKAVTVRDIRTDINAMEEQFRMALPSHIPSAKFVRTTLTAIQNAPDLLQADRQSLLSSCMKAAQDGLVLDGREAALVIFNTKDGERWIKKVSYLPMVQGILKKARNSGDISTIAAHVAYEKDKFTYVLGDEEKIIHEPNMLADRGRPIAAYAIVKLKDGSVQREVMATAEIEGIRKRSKAAQAGPWVTDWSEMARKTVLRRISKYIPSSTDKTDKEDGNSLLDITSRDDELYDVETGEVPETRQLKHRAAGAILEMPPTENVIEHAPRTHAEELEEKLNAVKPSPAPT